MPQDLSFNGQIAILHGRAGRKVFPCRDCDQVVNGETKKAKSPQGGIFWEKQATTDEKQIEAWWRQWPQALVGMPLQPAGFTVIDADCHHDGQHGVKHLREILEANRYPLREPWVQSPKGLHLYFKTPAGVRLKNGANGFPDGVEVKTAGGYMIAPHTRLPDGSEYVLHGDLDDAPELPPFFQSFVKKEQHDAARDNVVNFKTAHDDRRVVAYVEAAMKAELQALATTPKGRRNLTLNKAAFALGQLVGAGWISEDQVIAGLVHAAEACGVIADKSHNAAMRTIKSGLKAGIEQPRQLPEETEAIDPVLKERIRNMTFGGKRIHASDSQPSAKPKHDSARPTGTKDLNAMLFSPIRYVVPGYVAEGLTLIAGRPKIGKSWLVFDMALTVAGGGDCLGDVTIVAPGTTLYISLEDNFRRLQKRLRKIVPGGKDGVMPDNCFVVTEWPRANDGGLNLIRAWLDDYPDTRLIVIDSLPKFRAIGKAANVTQFDADFAAVQGLQEITSQYAVAIIVVVHTRKAAAESGDPMDKISGTLGLSAAADAILVLDRDPLGAFTLYGRGRDVEEIEAAISFSRESCRWTILGKAGEVRQTANRAAVLAALDDAAEPMSVTEIAAVTGQKAVNLRQILRAMVEAGLIVNAKRGFYQKVPIEDRMSEHDLDEGIE